MHGIYRSHVKFLRKCGVRGSGDGEFAWPQSLIIDGSGNVYVSDQGNGRIQVFDAHGRFLRKWGGEGIGDEEFSWTQGLGETARITGSIPKL